MTEQKERRKKLREYSDSELHRLRVDLRELSDKAGKLRVSTSSRLQSVDQEVRTRQGEKLETQSPEFAVSDHAMVRYFERVLGYDLTAVEEAIKAEVINGEPYLCDNLIASGDVVFIVRNNRNFVKTVMTKDMVTEDTVEQSKDGR